MVANYHSSEKATQAFAAETGIVVFKWDVSKFEAWETGVAEVEATVGPIDVLVKNAGITRYSTSNKMTPES